MSKRGIVQNARQSANLSSNLTHLAPRVHTGAQKTQTEQNQLQKMWSQGVQMRKYCCGGFWFDGVFKDLSQILVKVVTMCSLWMLGCSFRRRKLNFSANKDTRYVRPGSEGLGGLELVGRWRHGGEEKIHTPRVSPHAVRWPRNFVRVSILVSARRQWRCGGL